MDAPLGILLTTALGLGLVHTLIGVDHTLPFAVLGRAQGWPLRRLWGVTLLCGLGHVLASVVLGAAGIALGMTVSDLVGIEGARGRLAAWGLVVFGLTYAAWAVAARRRGQRHVHAHAGGLVHAHPGAEDGAHIHARPGAEDGAHIHARPGAARALTGPGLFAIFVLGPCEPLIPLLMVPALELGAAAAAAVALVFGLATLGTMLAVVTLARLGLRIASSRWLEANAHVLAGLAVAGSGLAIELFGI